MTMTSCIKETESGTIINSGGDRRSGKKEGRKTAYIYECLHINANLHSKLVQHIHILIAECYRREDSSSQPPSFRVPQLSPQNGIRSLAQSDSLNP